MKITFVIIALTTLCISVIGQEKPQIITKTVRMDAPPRVWNSTFCWQ
jgi:hypothetical protein